MNVVKHAAIAIAVAAVINTAIFYAGAAAGADYVVPQGPDGVLAPLGIGAVWVVTCATMAVGTGVYLLLDKFAPSWAWPVFLGLAAALFAVSFLPFGGDWSATNKIALGVMHVVAPGALIVALGRARALGTGQLSADRSG